MKSTRFFKTIIKKQFKTELGTYAKVSTYIEGRINGMMAAICDYPNGNNYGYARFVSIDDDDKYRSITKTKCTEEQYEQFKTIVEEYYPEACEFDIHETDAE